MTWRAHVHNYELIFRGNSMADVVAQVKRFLHRKLKLKMEYPGYWMSEDDLVEIINEDERRYIDETTIVGKPQLSEWPRSMRR